MFVKENPDRKKKRKKDKWLTPSIKDIEHIDRGAISTACEISVPSQKR